MRSIVVEAAETAVGFAGIAAEVAGTAALVTASPFAAFAPFAAFVVASAVAVAFVDAFVLSFAGIR